MAGQLRYELIGDASSFENAGREAAAAAEMVETNLEGLKGAAETAALAQLDFNEAAEQFTDTSGNFVSQASAQAELLEELNSLGVQTEAQYEAQISKLATLAEAVEEGSLAHQQLTQMQDRLQREMLQTAEASEQAASGMNAAAGPGAELGFIMQDLQQFQFGVSAGLRSISNNIPGIIQGFQRTAASGAGLASIFTGSAGLLIGVNALAGALPLLVSTLSDTSDETSNLASSASDASGEMQGLFEASKQLETGLPNLEQIASNVADSFSDIGGNDLQNLFGLFDRPLGQQIRQIEAGRGVQASVRRVRDAVAGATEEVPELETALQQVGVNVEQLLNENLRTTRQEIEENAQALRRLQEDPVRLFQDPKVAASALESQFQRVSTTVNQLVSDEIIGEEEAIQQRIQFLEERLKQASAEFDGLADEEQFAGLLQTFQQLGGELENLRQDAEATSNTTEEQATALDQAQQAVQQVKQQFEALTGEQGVELAIARRTREEYERQAQALRNVNRIVARRRSGTRAQQVQPADTAEVGNPQEDQQEAMRGVAKEARRAREEMRRLVDETEGVESTASDGAEEIESNVNQELVQGIQLASQLGATLIQSARQGSLSFKQAFSQILQIAGQAVGFFNPVTGAVISGVGSIIGSFQEGGQVRGPGGTTEDQIPAMLSDREFVVNAASAQQVLPVLEMINEGPAQAEAVRQAVAHMPASNVPQELASGGQVRAANQMVGAQAFASGGQARPRETHSTSMRAAESIQARKREVHHTFDFSLDRINAREIGLSLRNDEGRRDQFGYND